MTWINFLHFYQPANADFYDIKEALDKSYWRLLRLVEENPQLQVTWNISGCLLDRLAGGGEQAFIERLKVLVDKGRVELSSSAAYHGFLPLLPKSEVIRQIKENEEILKKYFGQDFKARGFFIPEMAYSSSLAKIIKKLGYSWIILDEIAYSGSHKNRPKFGKFYLDSNSGLKVIFRDRELSSAYPPDKLFIKFKEDTKINSSDNIYLTATDAELYGFRHGDPTGEMEKIVKFPNLKTLSISHLEQESLENKKNNSADKLEKISLYPSSWETSPQEIEDKTPYILWKDKHNKIQQKLWELSDLALSLGSKFPNDPNFYWYRWHLVRGLASCTFWWASARDFSKIYGPYAWSPDIIERGLEDLIRAVRSFDDFKSKKYKLKAEKYYLKIKKQIWEEHWKKHWKKVIPGLEKN